MQVEAAPLLTQLPGYGLVEATEDDPMPRPLSPLMRDMGKAPGSSRLPLGSGLAVVATYGVKSADIHITVNVLKITELHIKKQTFMAHDFCLNFFYQFIYISDITKEL